MLNNVIISGRLTKNPEIRYISENQTPVINFTLAVERDFSDESSERKTDFIPVVAWNGLAKFISGYFGKGGALTVQGRLQIRTWDDQDGKKHHTMEILAEKAYFAGDSKKTEDSVQEENTDYEVVFN